MSRDTDDLRRLRSAGSDLDAEESRRPDTVPADDRRWLGETVVGTTYPQTPNAFYYVQPQQVTGDEVEGGTATVAGYGPPTLCYNIGTAIPPVGQPVRVTDGRYRKTFAWYG